MPRLRKKKLWRREGQSESVLQVCTVMGTAGIPRGNRGDGDRFHGNTVGTGTDGVASHGVTVEMGRNADGNTAVKCET